MKKTNKKTILIVEDEPALVKIIRDKLLDAEFKVECAKTAEEAINEMNKFNKPDLIWLDHYLIGQHTGMEFLILLKSKPDWKNIPVFLVSVSTNPQSIQRYLKLGVEKFYAKSNFKLADIIQDVKNTLSNK